MPASSGFRAAVSCACLCVGLTGSVILYRVLRAEQEGALEVVLVEPQFELEQLEPELERNRAQPQPGPKWIQNFPGSTLKRFELTEERAQRLFPQIEHPWNRFDPLMYFGYEPDLHVRMKLEAHPDGFYWVTTNSLGLRREGEIAVQQPDLRILVAGDSHVDGVCNNSEAFPALLESALAADRPGQVVEVLNAARGGQSPFNYLGTLEKWGFRVPCA